MENEILLQSSEAPALRRCNDIHLPAGVCSAVYFGPAGVFATAETAADPEALYLGLREVLGTTKIRLYVSDSGLYDPLRGPTGQLMDEETLADGICEWIYSGTSLWDEARLEDLERRLILVDGTQTRSFTDSDGNHHVFRNGAFYPASSQSSEAVFYLTLFGGVLGLHRLFSGKIFTGLLYLCTGGLFGLGVLMDLISLFSGSAKDRRKRYYEPLRTPLKKLAVLPVGFACSALLLFVQYSAFMFLQNAAGIVVSQQLQQTNPATAIQIKFGFEQFIQNLLNNIEQFSN